ncbi:MAG TPA: FxsA family protein [Methylocella sp.]|nr:FxsA family protein [Methylocella sp.]
MLRLRSHGGFVHRPLVRLPVQIVLYFALWLAAELAAFGAVVHAIGFVGAIFACILTTLGGLAMLRRIGLSAALSLRQAVVRNAREHNGLSRDKLVDGTLAGLGAVLLILPGFVSDLAGLALAAPSFRLWVRERLNLGHLGHQRGRHAAPALIDLTPREWSRHEE